MCLNILFLLGCVPIFTVGVSACALYGVLREISEGKNRKLAVAFFGYYRSCLKRGVLLELGLVLTAVAMWWGYRGISFMDPGVQPFFRVVYITGSVVAAGLVIWSPSLLVWFGSGVKTAVKNAVYITAGSFHWFAVLVVVNLIPWMCLGFLPVKIIASLLPLLLLFGISLPGYLNTYIYKRAYRKYENLKYV